ncbi:Potassium channel domain-containing protein [Caenorhabditis elegans]|uniref:Potassium channel domain-containing protein n=1 Tax=Caenorhabditis elegans TaxID=6239 RepID=Q8IG65_CAEEL|nr:Potassium channel domain-containing protein [Caenorhabditis elegans]CCD64212.1 Potassium channel domain-containing protein [Caenorhabditis elegans]|eukprot:NP_491810.2 TWiK family of potassium channels [Caenorhabditis elegans]
MVASNRRQSSSDSIPSNQKSHSSNHHTSNSDGMQTHTDRLINKFIKRQMEKSSPETQHLVRKQSILKFVERKSRAERPKPTKLRTILRKIRKFNTIIAFVVLVAYIIGGALLFWQIESRSDMNINEFKRNIRQKSIHIYNSMKGSKCGKLKKADNELNNNCIKEIFDLLYASNPPKHIEEFLDGLAYVITCITTIGYGELVCHTIAGKLVTVAYGIIGIALTLYVLRNNGKITLKICNLTLKIFAICVRKCGKKSAKYKMTVLKAFILLVTFWGFGALAIAVYEEFVFYDALYFSFSTFSTIGFGDFVPSGHISGTIICVLHFIDLSLISMVLVLVHHSMENRFMRVLELFDERHATDTLETNMISPGASQRKLAATTTAKE